MPARMLFATAASTTDFVADPLLGTVPPDYERDSVLSVKSAALS
jgi:hypothetical protein